MIASLARHRGLRIIPGVPAAAAGIGFLPIHPESGLPRHSTTFFAAIFRLLLCLLLGKGLAWAQAPVPALKSRVTDLTGTLEAAGRQALEARLAQLEKARGSQLAVLLVPTTRPESVEQYALRVAESWRLGRKGVDDGVLLLVAKDDRALRIEVGYGLEGAIPDVVAKRVIEDIIVPRFKQGDFAGGIDAGVNALIRLIEGEPLPQKKAAASGASVDDALSMAMVFIFVVGGILRALFGALIGAALAAGVAFLGGWLLLGSLGMAAVVGLVVFFLTLIGISSVVGGGGGGGGFSGGGGGFGGGGASGRW